MGRVHCCARPPSTAKTDARIGPEGMFQSGAGRLGEGGATSGAAQTKGMLVEQQSVATLVPLWYR